MGDFSIHSWRFDYLTESTSDDQLKLGNYQTEHFDICPKAFELYTNIEDKVDDYDLAQRCAKLHDALFFIEKHVKKMSDKEKGFMLSAENIGTQIKAMADMMDLKEEHEYIEEHLKAVRDSVQGTNGGDAIEKI